MLLSGLDAVVHVNLPLSTVRVCISGGLCVCVVSLCGAECA